ncbi:vitamin D3 hydroxylase-associated protein-like [Rhinatrema bivittatum]|uniref:vitamin D3 hydroxylase-associated protein-like n=1 Tax=Rhinatrema bivittatum TaxID=194408 RepID=UPI001129A240|nr:vitamin D3 hydroxylase-associated protein-like [Rhinatrema bivittatum]
MKLPEVDGGKLLARLDVDPRLACALVCGSVAAVVIVKWTRRRQITRRIEERRRERAQNLQEMQEALLHFRRQHPSDHSESILSLSLPALTEKLREGSLSPESVLYTYMGKAMEVTQEVNCVTEFIQECKAQLQEVKQMKEKGLLYGVPVSIKEHINLKGTRSSCGLVQYLNIEVEEDSVIVQVLKKQGAIVFAKTNVPQAIYSFETSNPLFGQTVNPVNHTKLPAGSTGGEGALIGGGGSILGIGSDLGGSIRVPASFCGISGFKPTVPRLSNIGVPTPLKGLLPVLLGLGPMARDVDSLALCMKALLCDHMFRLDPSVPPIPFRDEVYLSTTPLRIGYYDTDGYTRPAPCMRRAIHETKALLEEAGHTLVPFIPPRIDYAVEELFLKVLFADGCDILHEELKQNIIDPNLKEPYFLYQLSNFAKRILAFVVKPVFKRFASMMKAACGVRTVKELWKKNAAVQSYTEEFISKWRMLNLDVVLCPVLGPAFNKGYPGNLMVTASSTILYNILNFPAGVLPVSTVTEEDERELKDFKGHHNDFWDKEYKKAMERGVGLPVAVQCVALPWQDELCLQFMKEVERLTQEKRKRK